MTRSLLTHTQFRAGSPHVSQRQLAERTGTDPQVIADLVNANRSIDDDIAARLARTFGTTTQFWTNLQAHNDREVADGTYTVIGRQVHTAHAGIIDLLALAPDGSIVVIELKRDMTPRDVVAQGLDYASWVSALEADDIVDTYNKFAPGPSLAEDFKARFHALLDEEAINTPHQIVIVASRPDASSERIVSYLNGLDVPIKVEAVPTCHRARCRFVPR